MSKNYDNWERLVAAVLRREWDNEIAMWDSIDLSSTSSTFEFGQSFSSISDQIFDHDHLSSNLYAETSDLPMDYSDLKLDHTNWKEMLPPDKQQFVWRELSLSFFLDQSTGKNCFLVGAGDLKISTQHSYRGHFSKKYHPKSRFDEVVGIVYSGVLDIKGSIKRLMLSPNTHYAVYLVFEFTEHDLTVPKKLNSCITIHSDKQDRMQERVVQFKPRNGRTDGWMEAKVGDFYVGNGGDGEVRVRLRDFHVNYFNRGFVVEGIEFRPSAGNKWGKGFFSNLKISS